LAELAGASMARAEGKCPSAGRGALFCFMMDERLRLREKTLYTLTTVRL
jgi:hypothetical protein